MKFILILIGFIYTNASYTQKYFSKNYTMDFAGSSLVADFIEVDNSIIVVSSHVCYDENENCTSLLKIDPNGDVVDELIINKFKKGNERCIIRKGDSIFVSGHSISGNFESVNFFKTTVNLDDFETFTYNEDDGSKYWNEGLINHGNSIFSYGDFNPPDDDTGEASILKWDNSLTKFDTIFRFKYGDGTNLINDLQPIGENKLGFIILSKYRNIAKEFYNIMEIDTLGNLISRVEYEDFPTNRLWPNLLVLPNGDYIISTNTTEEGHPEIRGQLSRLESETGKLIWVLRLPYNEESHSRLYSVFDIKLARNGDILLSGQIFDKETQFITYDVGFIIRMSQDGQVLWNRIYKIKKENPAAPYLYKSSNLRSIHELENGDIVGVGWSISYDENVEPRTDLWVIRVDANGCLYENCEEEQIITATANIGKDDEFINIYPNPTNGIVNISSIEEYDITISDLFGQQLMYLDNYYEGEVDISQLPSGIYFFKFEREGKFRTQKVIKTD